ncbi:MAG: hypothetical protein NWQ54_24825 [Paraglaciecola sp.]|uniref:DUF6942 family protein n=1 Tax=Paraglaciecola sp. TaxID=1920173 RepID=UPI00273D6983|nr:hypothetical protein [Paraglaciecola sp.]MDP5031216.1 hypothetical protein [Paraglaciecola sp.]MDP5134121.1 hypothetical protein [Paraglaciecola sp.]
MVNTIRGLGDSNAQFRVYIGNRPAFKFAKSSDQYVPLLASELKEVGLACGNGWRKVFNVYAKLVFALAEQGPVASNVSQFDCWQAYRDKALLQADSDTALCFEPYQLALGRTNALHIIMGRTYAKSLHLSPDIVWLDNEFALDLASKLIVCPYFDYRQLSNSKIIRLVEIILQVNTDKHLPMRV